MAEKLTKLSNEVQPLILSIYTYESHYDTIQSINIFHIFIKFSLLAHLDPLHFHLT